MINLAELQKKDIGRWVLYQSNGGDKIEEGRLKSWNDKFIFVVYKCDNQWDRYNEYTGAATRPEDLRFKGRITAHFNIQLWVECPHCKESFDVMKTDAWMSGGYEAVDEFRSQDNVDLELACPECKKEFVLNDVCY